MYCHGSAMTEGPNLLQHDFRTNDAVPDISIALSGYVYILRFFTVFDLLGCLKEILKNKHYGTSQALASRLTKPLRIIPREFHWPG